MSFPCPVCGIDDLHSQQAYEQHLGGRKHRRKLATRLPMVDQERPSSDSGPANSPATPTTTSILSSVSDELPPSPAEFFQALAEGKFRNVVVLTGAGVSTASGIPDFRTPRTGLFALLKTKFKDDPRFRTHLLDADDAAAWFLSREFVQKYPDVWAGEVREVLSECGLVEGGAAGAAPSGPTPPSFSPEVFGGGAPAPRPTEFHRFCAWLHHRGWLRMVFTQNVDGLHTCLVPAEEHRAWLRGRDEECRRNWGAVVSSGKVVDVKRSPDKVSDSEDAVAVNCEEPVAVRKDRERAYDRTSPKTGAPHASSLSLREDLVPLLPDELVVECHGSATRGDLVMYGDPLPARFEESAGRVFDPRRLAQSGRAVDLVIVAGSALQVAPFCAVPNLAPRHCVRALVNRPLSDVLGGNFWDEHRRAGAGRDHGPYGYRQATSTKIGKQRVTLKNEWGNAKRFRNVLFERDCDVWVGDFFAGKTSQGSYLG